ncbi:MAG: type II toxin-antitoxin system RelE/ParE family toxin [bacterium]|jgi:plasmid stabilization system protein ParE|nr:type II toxin-antitoxin system RelE/ParE family toxin [bacterium]
MELKISNFAQKELEDSIFFYELEQRGLGRRFKDEVRHAIDRIVKSPKAWPVERGEVRKCFVHKFPYKVLYSVQKDDIVVLAIAHQHRKPDYWIDQI